MIVGDVHVPFTDWEFAQRVVRVARKEKITKLLIAGDFWNYDHLSLYENAVVPPTWGQERDSGKRLIQAWGSWFESMDVIMGNHERRKSKRTNGHEDDEDIFSALAAVFPNLKSSIYGWCELISGGVPWRISHPRNYSVNQLSVADAVAQKFCVNTLTFHEHHLAIGYDRYGRHVIANGGCLADPRKLAYVHLDDSRSAGMKIGFAMIRNGSVTLFGKSPYTDWSRYGLA